MMRCPPSAKCGPIVRKKRGFNLIEAAVVLGIVGLVIGGIWVAAATLNEQWKAARHAQQLQLIANRTMTLLKGQSYSGGGWTSMVTELLAAGVFPEDMPVVSSYPRNPWGGMVSVSLAPGSPSTQFEVATRDLSYATCIKIVFAVAGTFKDGNFLSRINTSKMDNTNSVTAFLPLAITPHNSTVCNRDANSKLFFIFNPPLT